jgi:hypothetical protein
MYGTTIPPVASCGYDIRSVILRVEGVKMSENRLLRGVFEPKEGEVTESGRRGSGRMGCFILFTLHPIL